MLEPKTRDEFFRAMPQGGVCAEIGIWRGQNAKRIFDECKPSKLYLIDSWTPRADDETFPGKTLDAAALEAIYRDVRQMFAREITEGRVEILRGDSAGMAARFPDQSFDWVYVDAAHSYESVKADLAAWAPKVKPGGVLAGHDYVPRAGYGVIRAVDEHLKRPGFSWLMRTQNVDPDWALRVHEPGETGGNVGLSRNNQ